jgi:hypothetical protein
LADVAVSFVESERIFRQAFTMYHGKIVNRVSPPGHHHIRPPPVPGWSKPAVYWREALSPFPPPGQENPAPNNIAKSNKYLAKSPTYKALDKMLSSLWY